MMHGDDKGLILPPLVAPIQVVIIPIYAKKGEQMKIDEKLKEITEILDGGKIRWKIDDRSLYHPGWKYNFWELKGVPLRIEFGGKDLVKEQVVVVQRIKKEKVELGISEIERVIPEMLREIQAEMFNIAKEKVSDSIVKVENWEEFMQKLNEKKALLAAW